jgi:uncharacterized protein YjiS (DUF1127 family)
MTQATARCSAAGAYRAPTKPVIALDVDRFTAALRWPINLWRRAQAIRQLSRLNDRHLQDIGIIRGDIEAIADEMIRRRR